MKKHKPLIMLLAAASCFFITGCSYECEVYYMNTSPWSYEGTYSYPGSSEDEAHDACEDDWGAAYDCSDCKLSD